MAIITGMRPAEMGEIKPFDLPVADMAKGLLAVQKQADEVKNTIALGTSALAIETRPFQEDMNLSKKVQDDYMSEVNKLLVEVNGDYSKIDNSQIQSLATKFATDDRVRYLTNNKAQFDLANDLGRKINMTNGTEIFLGTQDPRKPGLYDENGNFYNFTNWEIQSQLKWVDDAASLYDNLGYKLQSVYGFDEKSKFADWKQYYQWEVKTSTRWNSEQVEAIKKDAVDLYDNKAGGKQYRRTRIQELKNLNPNYSDKEIKDIIDQEVIDMVFTLGEARTKYEYNEIIPPPVQVSANSTARTNIKGKGKTGDDEVTEVSPQLQTSTATFRGANIGSGTLIDLVDQMKDTTPIISDIQNLANNPSSGNNIQASISAMTGVSPNLTSVEKGDRLYFSGSLMNLDNMLDLTGSKNRSMFRISNSSGTGVNVKVDGFLPKTEAIQLNNLPDEESIMDINDYTKAYSQVFKTTTQAAKNKLLGTSNADGYNSMFDFYYDNTEKKHKVRINPVIQQVVTNLEQDIKKETDPVKKEYITNKLKRIKTKLDESVAFQDDHKDDLQKYEKNLDKIENKIKNYDRIITVAANNAGLSQDDLENFRKKPSEVGSDVSVFTKSKQIYDKAKLKATDNYIKSNFYSNTYQYSPYPSPLSVLDQLSGGKERKIGGSASAYGVGTSYTITEGYIDKSINKINSDDNIKNAWNFYNNFATDVLQQDLNTSDVINTIGKGEYEKLVKEGKNVQIFKIYATKKFNDLLKDNKNITYKNERQVFIDNMTQLGANVVNHDKKTFDKFTYNVPENYNQILEKVNKSTQEEVKKQAQLGKFSYDDKLFKFLYNVDEGLKMNYDADYVYYALPGRTSPDEKRLLAKTIDAAFASVGTVPLTRLRYNETDPTRSTLKEEYNTQDLYDNLAQMIIDKEGKDVKITPSKYKEYLDEIFIGVNMDTDNKEKKYPFTADFKLMDYKNGTLTEQIIQIPINLSPTDLMEYGMVPLEHKYMNDARLSLQENDGLFFTIDYEGKFQTTAFKAMYDIPGSDIKKGEFYVDDEINGKKSPRKLGTFRNAVGEHTGKIFNNLNMTALQQLTNIINEISTISDIRKKNDVLTTKYYFDKSLTPQDNIKILFEARDKILLKRKPAEEETLEEEEESGK
jgi:hypothetical protein